MSLQNALLFISKVKIDKALRQKINRLKSSEIAIALEQEGYSFTNEELEDAINSLKLKCATEEDAIEYEEIKLWFDLLNS
jgi:predicted ribosomally synthesized peptide with nif11-like leader